MTNNKLNPIRRVVLLFTREGGGGGGQCQKKMLAGMPIRDLYLCKISSHKGDCPNSIRSPGNKLYFTVIIHLAACGGGMAPISAAGLLIFRYNLYSREPVLKCSYWSYEWGEP